ncbi:MAG: ATP-binding cassette domain-containing protein [Demequinaceae bacterium]|nr:ATP-binding cassette domain-containing protein [Demequinaceae bacterium]
MTETLTAPTVEYGADALIVCDNLVRIYQVENIEVQALQGLDLLVEAGEMVAIVGQSGSGKSTLLNVLSGLDVPTAGAARVAGWDLLRMSHADRLTYRRTVVGFVWQQTGRNLLPYLNARENVMLPMAFAGIGSTTRRKRANELLDAMNMGHMANRRPGQLSGGEQQRVAIAVALANRPQVLFADEPTGELDSATGDDVFEALRAANRDLGAAVVVVTHDSTVSGQVQRTVAIRDGRTSSEVVRRTRITAEGVTEVIAEEYAVLDRAGRMQLPKEYRKTLGLKDRVRLELEPDHIGVWADGTPHRPKPHPTAIPQPNPVEAANPPPIVRPPAPPTTDGSPAFPAPSDAPHLHFQAAPERPSPEQQASAGHPLAGMAHEAEAPEGANPYTPRVPPPTASRPKGTPDEGGEQ